MEESKLLSVVLKTASDHEGRGGQKITTKRDQCYINNDNDIMTITRTGNACPSFIFCTGYDL